MRVRYVIYTLYWFTIIVYMIMLIQSKILFFFQEVHFTYSILVEKIKKKYYHIIYKYEKIFK